MKTKFILAVLLAGAVAAGTGCAVLVVGAVAAGAGAGTYAYVDGELKENEAVSYDTAYDATLAAMKDMGYAVLDHQKGSTTAKISARSTSDKKILVTLNKQSQTITEIRIRVGTFGDEPMSREVLDKIKSHF